MTSEAKCPYCDVALESFPQRKTKCPNCKQPIYSKTNPETRKKILVKEDEIDELEERYEEYRFLKQWKGRLSEFGVSDDEYQKFKSTFPSKNEHDVIYGMFNTLLYSGNVEGNIHYTMALFLNDEGKDPYPALYANAKQTLLGFKHIDPTTVIISGGGNGCPDCRQMDGKAYPYKQALEEMPLPHKGCTFVLGNGQKPFCRCLWVARLS